MKKIDGVVHISQYDNDVFHEQLSNRIFQLQNELNLDGEVQYSTATHLGQVMFTAVILGRKKEGEPA